MKRRNKLRKRLKSIMRIRKKKILISKTKDPIYLIVIIEYQIDQQEREKVIKIWLY